MDEQVHGELDAEGLRAVIAGLTPRQQTIAKLRFDWQLSPQEIASVMDLPVERCYAELKHVCRKLRREARRMQRGEHMPRYERLLYRYVAGIASKAERAEAASLLEHSSQARMIASAIRRQADGLGALLPAPVLAAAPAEAPSRLAEVVAGAKQQLADAGAHAKQQAAAVSARVGETLPPMPRGGVATVLSLCAAAGGTAGTYCAVEGVDPIKPLVGVIAPEEEKPAGGIRPVGGASAVAGSRSGARPAERGPARANRLRAPGSARAGSNRAAAPARASVGERVRPERRRRGDPAAAGTTALGRRGRGVRTVSRKRADHDPHALVQALHGSRRHPGADAGHLRRSCEREHGRQLHGADLRGRLG